MARVARRDTGPELAVRRLLWGRGFRYRIDIAPVPGLRSRADIVFTRSRVAIYIDGCFWHGCPQHGVAPKHNADWWAAKLDATAARDRRADKVLRERGWTVVRVWEHEDPRTAAQRIAMTVEAINAGAGLRAPSSPLAR